MLKKRIGKLLTLLGFLLLLTALATVSVSAAEDSRYAAFDEAMIAAIEAGDTEIDVQSLGLYASEISAFYSAFCATQPDYSFCIEMINYSYNTTTGLVTKVIPTYDDLSTVAARRAEIQDEVERVAAAIDPAWSELYKVIWINNYICDHYRYELTTSEYHDVYNFIVHGEGVCEAYTALFTLLAREAGLEVSFCHSNALVHIWNMVKVDGEWYHVDVTWNDRYSCRYEYLLLSDLENTASREATHGAFDTFALYTAESTRFDSAPWRDGWYSAISPVGSSYYFVEEGSLYRVDLDTLAVTSHRMLGSYKWHPPGNPSMYYLDTYFDTLAHGDLLLYNTPDAVYALSPSTGVTAKIYDDPQQALEIYGLSRDGNDLLVVYYNPETELEQYARIEHYFASPHGYCTVTFEVDGEEYQSTTVVEGSVIALPSTNPTKASDAYYDYQFLGWDGYTEGMTASGYTVTLQARFASIPRSYRVEFWDGDQMLSFVTCPAGTEVASLQTPTVPQEKTVAGVKYRFTGWNFGSETVLADRTVSAVYEPVPMFTVTYYNGETVFHEETVEEGTVLEWILEIPTKESTATHRFVFSGWVGALEGSTVEADLTLHALYVSRPLEGSTEDGIEGGEPSEQPTGEKETEPEEGDGEKTDRKPSLFEDPTTVLYLAAGAGGLLVLILLIAAIAKGARKRG